MKTLVLIFQIIDQSSLRTPMASARTQFTQRRSIKQKTQYSPSNPCTTALYHLIKYDDTDTIVIVASSSIKQHKSDGTMVLNDNRTAKSMGSGDMPSSSPYLCGVFKTDETRSHYRYQRQLHATMESTKTIISM